MVNFHTHQRLAHLLAEDIRFVVRFPLLYYSYVAKFHFCTEEFNIFYSPQSCRVVPQDCFFKSSGCIEMQNLIEIMMLQSNTTGVQDLTGIQAFKAKLPNHNLKISLLLDFGCPYMSIKACTRVMFDGKITISIEFPIILYQLSLKIRQL